VSRHLLVTNDYPPKIGGIQQYLWELWRRLDPATFEVHTTPHKGTEAFDAEQDYVVHRSKEPFLIPYPWLPRRINDAAARFDANLIVLDPAVPLGMIGPSLDRPYVAVLHGAEVTVPGRLPVAKQALTRVLTNAHGVISAGNYALAEAERAIGRSLDNVVVPPGVDTGRYAPISADERLKTRARYSVSEDAQLVLSVSRLVPRKGMDTLIDVAARLRTHFPKLQVLIAGAGRDERRLRQRITSAGAPVRLLGRIPESEKASLYAASDLFAMLCRNRWGGLEQEGFGIVFLEAAAAGVPQIAGSSGGAAEAVAHDETGLVVSDGTTTEDLADQFAALLNDDDRRQNMGEAARKRAVAEFDYDVLAARLATQLERWS